MTRFVPDGDQLFFSELEVDEFTEPLGTENDEH